MKLYGFERPTRATRVRWALEEAGVAYEHVVASPHDPELRALNPLGKVPCLVDGELVLTESAACCTWVGTRSPDSGLVPTDPHERARYDMWLSFFTTELEQPMWLKAKQKVAWPREHRCPQAIAGAEWDFARSAAFMEHHLGEGPFLVGDRFTCADLIGAHTLSWARIAKFEVSDRLRAWAAPHLARPALARALKPGA